MSKTALAAYLESIPHEDLHPAALSYVAALSAIERHTPAVAASIVQELADQRSYLKLIASENYCSLETQLAMGNLLTDKYAEGIPGRRFYEGCDNVDEIELLACAEACKLFGAEHAYVQPHSGADANLVAFWAVLTARVETPALARFEHSDPTRLTAEDWNGVRQAFQNQRLLGMDYSAGGHLTHGYRRNVSGKMFESYSYGVDPESGRIDYEDIARQAEALKPLILLAGYSAYPRKIDFRRMRQIADGVGAVLMVDMAHFAGLVAGKVFTGEFDPVAHAHIVTTTTHKTLRGPRGGMILCNSELAEFVDKGCPIVLGGPLPHVIAAKALAFREANRPEFQDYARRVARNARALGECLVNEGFIIATNGTDNHLLLVDVMASRGLTGRQAAGALRECGITLNFNSIPNDPNGPLITSGLRLGTPAVSSLGMGEKEMGEIAGIITFVLAHTQAGTIADGPNAGKSSKRLHALDDGVRGEARARVRALLDPFPVYPELDLGFLQEHFGK